MFLEYGETGLELPQQRFRSRGVLAKRLLSRDQFTLTRNDAPSFPHMALGHGLTVLDHGCNLPGFDLAVSEHGPAAIVCEQRRAE